MITWMQPRNFRVMTTVKLDSVGKDPAKGGKPNGVPYNFGQGRTRISTRACLRTRCKETLVNGPTRQRKGKVTASPRAKVKAKARENIQEKGPQSGPGWISELRWTAHVG